MITIHAGTDVVTLIQAFTVEPPHQQELLELLTDAYDGTISQAPGFVSCSLHRGLDGSRVTMYVQWRSMQHYEALLADPSLPAFLYRALTISTFEAGRFEVVRTFEPGDPPEA